MAILKLAQRFTALQSEDSSYVGPEVSNEANDYGYNYDYSVRQVEQNSAGQSHTDVCGDEEEWLDEAHIAWQNVHKVGQSTTREGN